MSTLEERQRKHVFYTWSVQDDVRGFEIDRSQGASFWTRDGKHWIDFESQVYNAHLGHGHPRVIEAIRKQVGELAVAHPAAVFETKVKLGEKLAQVTPQGIDKFFFTLGGSEANENALKIARIFTGRHKVISRYNSYHGATYGALSLTGDKRRIPFEPGISGVVKVLPPDCYRSPDGLSDEETAEHFARELIRVAEFEDPSSIAALFIEPIGGAVGGYMPGPRYLQILRQFCDEHGILLVADEVLTGFGRTGKWFAVEHSDVIPDMLVMAKGITSGYAPLGALGLKTELAAHFDNRMLWAGLTGYAHPLSCAAALSTIEVMEDEGLIERSLELGELLQKRLDGFSKRFEQVGEGRARGLYGVIEFVAPGQGKTPLVPEGATGAEAKALGGVREALKGLGVHMAIKGPRAFIAPPLTIEPELLTEGLDRLENAMEIGFGTV